MQPPHIRFHILLEVVLQITPNHNSRYTFFDTYSTTMYGQTKLGLVSENDLSFFTVLQTNVGCCNVGGSINWER